MANKLYEENSVKAIADAIRKKNGLTKSYTIGEMGGAVEALSSQGTEAIAHANIPDNIKSTVLEVAKKVQAVQTSESITFIAMSDAHQLDSDSSIVAGNLHAGMASKIFAYILPGLDFCCYLGDYTAGSSTTTLAEGRYHINEINTDIDEAFEGIPQFRTLGNHDSLQYSKTQNGGVLSASELYAMVGAYNNGAVMGSTTEGYCYRDFDSKKLRVICLNTAEATEKENVSDTQKLWFANTLKVVGAKSGWNVIILSHHPLDWGNVCALSNTVKAYVDGTSITIGSNTINFSGSNGATILAAIHGHVHGFKAAKLNEIANGVGTEYNIWRIATPNMCFARNNEYGQNGNTEYYGIEFGEDTTYSKTSGTANDTSFVVNVINPSEQKIYSFCYGAGYDREIFTGVQTISVTSISLNATSGELTVNDRTTLTATVIPSDASNKNVTWTSSTPTVASVQNGVVTALKAGSTVITAKTVDGGFIATYNLTVKAAVIDLMASHGYADNTRLSTSSGVEKTAAGYVTIGHSSSFRVDRTAYPNGYTIRVEGADDVVGNGSPYTDSAYVLYADDSTTFKYSTYITNGNINNSIGLGTITVDSDRKGFTMKITQPTTNKSYLKFCVKGSGANITATLTPN